MPSGPLSRGFAGRLVPQTHHESDSRLSKALFVRDATIDHHDLTFPVDPRHPVANDRRFTLEHQQAGVERVAMAAKVDIVLDRFGLDIEKAVTKQFRLEFTRIHALPFDWGGRRPASFHYTTPPDAARFTSRDNLALRAGATAWPRAQSARWRFADSPAASKSFQLPSNAMRPVDRMYT